MVEPKSQREGSQTVVAVREWRKPLKKATLRVIQRRRQAQKTRTGVDIPAGRAYIQGRAGERGADFLGRKGGVLRK
jgi:hypothetical protein